jgi:hypothetical protein
LDSIRFKTTWLQNFFLFAIIWAFGINLKEKYKLEFEEFIKKNCVDSAARKIMIASAPKKPKNSSDSSETSDGSEASYQA